MNQSQQANLIKIAAVITASPRWVGALLAAEGLAMPDSWRIWWLPLSALLSAGMALVEGLAFSFVFNAWRVQKDKSADRLLWLALLSAVVFIAVLAPFIAAQVRGEALSIVLGTGWALWAWSASVAASTIVIVASVGYAQKQKASTQSHAQATRSTSVATTQHTCWCGRTFGKQQSLASHTGAHAKEARAAESVPAALIGFKELYPDNSGKLPTIEEIREWRK